MFSTIRLLMLSVWLWLSATGQAQTADSVLLKKATEAFAIAFRNTDSAMMMAKEVLAEASRQNDQQAVANACNSIGWTFMHKGNFDSSLYYLLLAREKFSQLKSLYDVVRVDINLAEVYTKQNQTGTAIRYLLQADSLSHQIGHVPLQTDVKRQLAIIYRESGDFDRSVQYFQEALNGFDRQKDYFRYVNTSVSLSILYRSMKKIDSSLVVLDRSYKTVKEHGGTPYQMAMIEENRGETYFTEGKFLSALLHFTNAYQTFRALNNRADLAYEAFCLGKTYKASGRYAEAEKYLLQAYAINDSLKMINYQYDASIELSSLYKAMGNWQKALVYRESASELKDSIGLEEQLAQTNELKERYESEKQASEILLLKTQSALATADGRRARLMLYIFLLLFMAAVSIGLLLINRNRIKRKLEQQVLRNRIAGDLHDDIGSALSSIDLGSQIALKKHGNDLSLREQLTKISQQAQKTMESMSEIVWSLNPVNDNMESLLARMQEFASEICEAGQIQLLFLEPADREWHISDPDRRKNIFLIFKEAVNNACKYSQGTLLTVWIARVDRNRMSLNIEDNGIGFSAAEVKMGNGLRNMQSRAQQLEAELTVGPGEKSGTRVSLQFSV